MSTRSELLVCADWHKLEAKKLRELATMHEDQCDCIRMMADSLSMQAKAPTTSEESNFNA